MENLVLDHVGLEEGRAACVQRLEYDVRIVRVPQIDDDDLQFRPHGLVQRIGGAVAPFRLIPKPVEPSRGLALEVLVSLHDAGRGMVRPGRLVAHGMPEGGPVRDGGPHLEGVIRFAIMELLPVGYERGQPFGGIGVPSPFQHFLDRVDEQLKGGQPLLTVDYDAALDRRRGDQLLLKHDCAHEVRFGLIAIQERLGQGLDVVPERLPLLGLFPHIATLEGGNLVADWLNEQPLGELQVRYHVVAGLRKPGPPGWAEATIPRDGETRPTTNPAPAGGGRWRSRRLGAAAGGAAQPDAVPFSDTFTNHSGSSGPEPAAAGRSGGGVTGRPTAGSDRVH